jgi:hypothetical protein
MAEKSSMYVGGALEAFWDDVKDVKTMTSDQDSSYCSMEIQQEFRKRKIKHITTYKNNHHILGIINRLMRTLRDLLGGDNRDFTNKEMQSKIAEYNNMVHTTTGVAPNKMNKKLEHEFIDKMTEKAKTAMSYNFKVGDWVRRIIDRELMKKRRTNVTFECYRVKRQEGSSFIIEAKDLTIEKVPGFKLVKVPSQDVHKYPWAETLGKQRDSEIISFDLLSKKYQVHREGTDMNSFEEVGINEFRDHSHEMSREEKIYWVKTCPNFKDIPEAVKYQIPKQKEPHEIVDMIPVVSKQSGKAQKPPTECFVKSTDLLV